MTSLILPSRLTRQPQQSAPLDRNNPLTQGLSVVINPAFTPGPTELEVVTGQLLVPTVSAGALAKTTGTKGIQTNVASGTQARYTLPFGPGIGTTGDFTLVALARGIATGFNCLVYVGTSFAGLAANGGSWVFSNGLNFVTGAAVDPNKLQLVIAMRRGGQRYLWVDGVMAAPVADSNINPANMALLSRNSASDAPWVGQVAFFAAYGRGLSDATVASITANPYQIFKAPQRSLWAASSVPAGNTYSLSVAQGSYTIAGSPAGLRVTRRLAASVGLYTLTGNAASLTVVRRMPTSAGAFALAGSALTLRAARRMAAGPAAFSLSAGAAQMTYTPASGQIGTVYALAAVAGAFGLAGSAVTLKAHRRMTAAPEQIVLSGSPAGLSTRRRLVTGVGELAVQGSAIVMRAARRAPAQTGMFNLVGTAVQLQYIAGIPGQDQAGPIHPNPARTYVARSRVREYVVSRY
jgi:hypothetical protein